jgi:cytochrome o ubiquinol oxidase subunit 2
LPDWEYSGQLELLVWSIPVMVVLFLGGVAWVGSHLLDPYKPLPGKPLRVQVVALDWKWLFVYPDQGIATVNRLVVPAGTPIAFEITSATVMNSFFVPQLGSQIYAIPVAVSATCASTWSRCRRKASPVGAAARGAPARSTTAATPRW